MAWKYCFTSFLDANLQAGIDVVLDETRFQERVKDAQIVITGEGKMDEQTIYGKTPIGVAKVAKAYDIPLLQFVVASVISIKKFTATALTLSLALLSILLI